MSIKYAILGLLSWSPLTGYDLKKRFADLPTLYWSGNNNQIYRTLVDLHRDQLVTLDVQPQADHPPRKVYSITAQGQADLRQWVLSAPELPQNRNTFLIQLAWADQLTAQELDHLLAEYEDEIRAHILGLRTQQQRGTPAPARTPRETFLWDSILEHWITTYEHELNWISQLRGEISRLF